MTGTHGAEKPRTLITLLAALVLLAACASPPQSQPPARGSTAGSFVGHVDGTEALVAVVAAEGASGAARPVRIYVCETEVLAEWFTGAVDGDHVELTSESGLSSITADLTPERVTGQVTLPDGSTRAFTAAPSVGIDGLYEVSIMQDGRVVGASDRGLDVTGRITDQSGDPIPLKIDVTSPDGVVRHLENETTGQPPFADIGDGRWIILDDGTLTGAVKSRSDDTVFIWAGPNPR